MQAMVPLLETVCAQCNNFCFWGKVPDQDCILSIPKYDLQSGSQDPCPFLKALLNNNTLANLKC